jgi:hypothetical protein
MLGGFGTRGPEARRNFFGKTRRELPRARMRGRRRHVDPHPQSQIQGPGGDLGSYHHSKPTVFLIITTSYYGYLLVQQPNGLMRSLFVVRRTRSFLILPYRYIMKWRIKNRTRLFFSSATHPFVSVKRAGLFRLCSE